MNEVTRLIAKVQENGLFYYLVRPQLAVRYGTRNIEKLIRRLPYRRELIYVVEIPLATATLSSNIPTLRIQSVPPLLEFAGIREREDPTCKGSYEAELERRFSRGDICFAALENDKIVAVQFLTFGQGYIGEIDYLFTFPEKACGSIDSYTLRQFRGRSFHEATHYAILSYLAGTEFKSVYGWIPPWNKAAFKVHNKLGFKNIFFEITMKQRLGFRHHIIRELNTTVDEFFRDR